MTGVYLMVQVIKAEEVIDMSVSVYRKDKHGEIRE